MKNSYLIAGAIIVVAALGLMLSSKKTEAPVTLENSENIAKNSSLVDGTYKISTESSTISWLGEMATGLKKEEGTVTLSSGNVIVKDGVITSGEFVIDMESIKSNPMIDRLVTHLKSPDFFDVAKYPTAKFTLKGTQPSSEAGGQEGRLVVYGDLTVKGITKPISFTATVTQSEDQISGTSSFAINRAEWEIRYGSSSFFSDLGDKVIRDAVTIGLDLKAEKVIE